MIVKQSKARAANRGREILGPTQALLDRQIYWRELWLSFDRHTPRQRVGLILIDTDALKVYARFSERLNLAALEGLFRAPPVDQMRPLLERLVDYAKANARWFDRQAAKARAADRTEWDELATYLVESLETMPPPIFPLPFLHSRLHWGWTQSPEGALEWLWERPLPKGPEDPLPQ